MNYPLFQPTTLLKIDKGSKKEKQFKEIKKRQAQIFWLWLVIMKWRQLILSIPNPLQEKLKNALFAEHHKNLTIESGPKIQKNLVNSARIRRMS